MLRPGAATSLPQWQRWRLLWAYRLTSLCPACSSPTTDLQAGPQVVLQKLASGWSGHQLSTHPPWDAPSPSPWPPGITLPSPVPAQESLSRALLFWDLRPRLCFELPLFLEMEGQAPTPAGLVHGGTSMCIF